MHEDPFALLGVERRFDLDLKVLEKTHRELSRALHPDRYALADARAGKDLAKVRAIGEAMTERAGSTQKKLADGFASVGDVTRLVPLLGELRFYKRFLDEVAAIEEENEDTRS